MFHSRASRRSGWLALVAVVLVVAAPALAQQQVNPFGNCCVAGVSMTNDSDNAWTATCGSCSENPGNYTIVQPDPLNLVFRGPNGVTAQSPYEAAMAICRCPSQDARRAWEKSMRTYDGN